MLKSQPIIAQTEEVTPEATAGEVIATIPVGTGEGPLSQAVGEGAFWIHNNAGDVLRIDPATNQVVATIHVGGGEYSYMAIGEGALWVGMYDNNAVARIDPQTNTVVATIPVGSAPEGIGVTPGAVWVANHHDGSVSRIDPATNTVVTTITDVGHKGSNGPLVLITGAGSVWVEVPNINAVVRIDPATNQVIATLTGYTGGLGADSESFWYGTSAGMSRIDPATNQIVAIVPLQGGINWVTVGLGSIWVATSEGLLRIDPQTNQVVGVLPLSSGANNDTVAEGSVWVSIEASQSLLRIEPAPIGTPEATAQAAASLLWQTDGGMHQFGRPNQMAVDSQNNLYVVDGNNGRIQKFAPDGTFLLMWGSHGTGESQFYFRAGESHTSAIAVDDQDTIYAVDYSGRVQKFDTSGHYLGLWNTLRTSATVAAFKPESMVIDHQGNFYIAYEASDTTTQVDKYDSQGHLLDWGRDSLPKDSLLSSLTVDAQDNLYATDYGTGLVYKFDSTGKLLSTWGGTGNGEGQFNGAAGIAVDGQGNIYVGDNQGNRVEKFDPSGTFLGQWATQGNVATAEYFLSQVIVDHSGDVYVTEGSYGENDYLKKYSPVGSSATPEATPETTSEATAVVVDSTPSGSPLTLVWQTGGAPDELLISPNHLALDAQGNVYVGTEAEKGSVRVFDANGKFVTDWSAADHIDGGERGGASIGFDPEGNVYISDFYTAQVEKFDSTGTLLTQWATESPLGPSALAVDSQGNIYVVNHRTHDHYIQKFDSNGQLLAEWGTTGTGDGQIGAGAHSGPEDIAVDQAGNIYITDLVNNRIEKFDSNGNFLATFGTLGYHGNGQLSQPYSVAVDEQGNIYVADFGFIQKLDATGKFLAEWPILTGPLQGAGQIAVDAQGNIYLCAQASVYATLTKHTILIPVLKKFSQS